MNILLASITSGSLIHLLAGLLVLAIVVWLMFYILNMLPLPPQIKTIATVVFALILLLVLLNYLRIF